MRLEPLTFQSETPIQIDWHARLTASWFLVVVLGSVHLLTAPLAGAGFSALVLERTALFRSQLGGQVDDLVAAGELWRLASSVALHVDGLHLFVNLVALIGLGRLLEPWIGGFRLLGWFCAGGIFASACSHLSGIEASDGASGGAFALLGALVLLGWDAKLEFEPETAWMLRSPVRWLAALNLVLPLFLTFLDGVGHFAGFVVGMGLLVLARRWPAAAALLDLCSIGVVACSLSWALLQAV